MARIARRVPSAYDEQVARIAPDYLISQLERALGCLPPLEEPAPAPNRQRYHRRHTGRDGWTSGEYCLPPDEAVVLERGMTAAREAEFRDRHDLAPDAEVTQGEAQSVDGADALVRMASEAADALDAHLQRTGTRGDRFQVVLHQQADADGRIGPARLHLGPFVDRATARYLAATRR